MTQPIRICAIAVVAILGLSSGVAAAGSADAEVAAFEAYTGARLVFSASELPEGNYYDVMRELPAKRRALAARIALREAQKYPRGYLGDMGLEAIGLFDGLASKRGDGYRGFDKKLGGYRYYGLWNGDDALVAAYYTDAQLPLTLHHEIFHHVDATRAGKTNFATTFYVDDARFDLAHSGKQRYPALKLSARDVVALEKLSRGVLLRQTVSAYASKATGEDQAETARHLMTSLPDSLLQMARRPRLPGSQRMLHVLHAYAKATDKGPGIDWFVDWFVDVALGRAARRDAAAEPLPTNAYSSKVDAAISDAAMRRAIRRAQPAAVRLGGGSGVNLAPSGLILTAAHVVDRLGETKSVLFPDGRRLDATTIVYDKRLDVAVLQVDSRVTDLPFAYLSGAAPAVGATAVTIGQPGRHTPGGEATGYQPFHVSVGRIRGFVGDRLGAQSLGRTKHDAWTYWGHSGAPIFDADGRIIAMHNSWDSSTGMRHAVTWEAVMHVLREAGMLAE